MLAIRKRSKHMRCAESLAGTKSKEWKIIKDGKQVEKSHHHIMYLKYLLFVGFLLISHVESGSSGFIYNGFKSRNLTLEGEASITDNGLLRLTNFTKNVIGHAFHPDPIPFKPSEDGSVLSFSTTFVFAIARNGSSDSGHGLVFVIAPSKGFPHAITKPYLGMFNRTTNGNSSNHVVGVEMDTIFDPEVDEIDGDHVGIDIYSVVSANSSRSMYYTPSAATPYENISLSSGKPIQVWVEYDGFEKMMSVTIAPINISKSLIPLLTLSIDLTSVFANGSMYAGFSSATATTVASHYILGWSFGVNATAPPLDILNLPLLPDPPVPNRVDHKGEIVKKILIIGLPTLSAVILAAIGISYWVFHTIQRKKRDAEDTEVLEDWESEYGPHRFRNKDLYEATKGFSDKEVVGEGGFGKVYKGVLPGSNTEVAVKKVAHDARQGMRSFVAEIVSLGQLRHRNLVRLLGYCRRRGDLLLVYEFIPNGSLDRYLHRDGDTPGEVTPSLSWKERFNIIKGVAAGLLYLHEGHGQVVVHRDIKASNVLLDSEMNGRLSDFGLARLHERGGNPRTTNVIGTLGYIAPELSRTGRPTPSTDMFAFGAFLLEVVCGRRPIDLSAPIGEAMLVDMVLACWKRGVVLVTVDNRLRGKYVEEEAEVVLKLGLMCSNFDPEMRPTIRDAVAYLDKVVAPQLEGIKIGSRGVDKLQPPPQALEDVTVSFDMMFSHSGYISESQLSQGR